MAHGDVHMHIQMHPVTGVQLYTGMSCVPPKYGHHQLTEYLGIVFDRHTSKREKNDACEDLQKDFSSFDIFACGGVGSRGEKSNIAAFRGFTGNFL